MAFAEKYNINVISTLLDIATDILDTENAPGYTVEGDYFVITTTQNWKDIIDLSKLKENVKFTSNEKSLKTEQTGQVFEITNTLHNGPPIAWGKMVELDNGTTAYKIGIMRMIGPDGYCLVTDSDKWNTAPEYINFPKKDTENNLTVFVTFLNILAIVYSNKKMFLNLNNNYMMSSYSRFDSNDLQTSLDNLVAVHGLVVERGYNILHIRHAETGTTIVTMFKHMFNRFSTNIMSPTNPLFPKNSSPDFQGGMSYDDVKEAIISFISN